MSHFRNCAQLGPGKLINYSLTNYHSVFNAKVLQRAQAKLNYWVKITECVMLKNSFRHELYEYTGALNILE